MAKLSMLLLVLAWLPFTLTYPLTCEDDAATPLPPTHAEEDPIQGSPSRLGTLLSTDSTLCYPHSPPLDLPSTTVPGLGSSGLPYTYSSIRDKCPSERPSRDYGIVTP